MKKLLKKCTKILSAGVLIVSTIFSSVEPLNVKAATISYDGNAIVEEAKKHIGKAYVWGATGPNTFDCSGFVQYVFDAVGYAIPRTAEQQRVFMLNNAKELPKTDTSTWNVGDLVFYGNSGEADHVAIYAGNGEVIDCLGSQVSSRPGVTQHKFDVITDKNGHKYAIMGVYSAVQPKGGFQIVKTDEIGNKLSGAVFKITNESTGKSRTATTDANGIINILDIEIGTKFTVTETKAPDGYLLDSTPKTIIIKDGDNVDTTKLTFVDKKPVGEITLIKYNYDKSAVIPNTVYTVEYPDASTRELITDANGQIVLENLTLFGVYTFTEKQAAPGYIIDTHPIYVKLEYINQEEAVISKLVEHINHEPSGTLILTKIDAENVKAQGAATLEGAMYEIVAAEDIYNAAGTKVIYPEGKVVAVRYSDKDGKMEPVRGLYMGKYSIFESSAPNGYKMNYKEYTVTFTKKDETQEIVKYLDVEDYVIKGTIAINKVTDASGSNTPLAYIPFTLTNKTGKEWSGVTDANGYLEFKDLPYDTYYLNEEEVENNKGLSLLKNKEIIIDGSQDVYEYTIVNKAPSMSFYKIDGETKENLSGATLLVSDKETGAIVDQWVSDGKVHEIKGLIAGNEYLLREIKAPNGYQLANFVTFTAKDGGSVTLENYKIVETVDVVFSKQDITTKVELPGAKLSVTELNTNKLVEEWVSTSTPKTIRLKKGKQYIFEEVTAPDGYVQAEVIIFTAGNEEKITMYDDYTKVDVLKVNEEGTLLPGAKLQLARKNGEVIETWTSGLEAKNFTRLSRGKYVLTELEAPQGYIVALPIEFEVLNDAKKIEIKMINSKTPEVEIEFEKLDFATSKPLTGAELEIKDAKTNAVVDSWISTDENHKTKLTVGKEYIFTEISAPNGYIKAESIKFTAGSKEKVTMYNDYTKVSISKLDENGDLLPGASFELKNSLGQLIAKWDSTNAPKLITKLNPGETYYLVEVNAPDGYEKDDYIQFTVKNTTDVQNVEFINYPTNNVVVEIEKIDINTNKPLVGAKLSIWGSQSGEFVTEWISGEEPHKVTLIKGEKYVIFESEAPNGYATAEPVRFTAENNDKITVYNDYTKVLVNKTDINGNPLEGAKFELRDSKNKLIEAWTSTKESKLFTKLLVGETYTIIEVEAPKGYEIAEPLEFTVEDTVNHLNITIINNLIKTVEVEFEKLDFAITKPLPGAKLEIKDAVTGEIVDSWISTNESHKVVLVEGNKYIFTEISAPEGYEKAESIEFIAGTEKKIVMFNDYSNVEITISKLDSVTKDYVLGAKFEIKEYETGKLVDSWVSEGNPHKLTLKGNTVYVLTEVEIPEGYTAEKTSWTFNSSDVKGGYAIYNIKVVTPEPEPEEPINPEPTPSQDEEPAPKPEVEPESPVTGDNANVLTWILAGLASVVVLVIALLKSKKEKE